MIKYNFSDIQNIKPLTYDKVIKKSKLTSVQKNALKELNNINTNGKYSNSTFIIFPIENNYIIGWEIIDLVKEDTTYGMLYHKKSDSLITLDDIINLIADDKFKDGFSNICKKNEWSIIFYDEEKTKYNQNKISKELNFDTIKVDKLWRKRIYNHKKLTDDEKKQIIDACHTLLDVCSKKNIDAGEIGLSIYTKLLDLLDINV